MEILNEGEENSKALKKVFSKVGRTLIKREVLLGISQIIMVMLYLIYIIVKYRFDENQIDTIGTKMVENPVFLIVSVMIAFIPIYNFTKKNIDKDYIFNENKKFRAKDVFVILILFLGLNCLFGMISDIMESGLNIIGFTMKESADILESLNIPSMALYVCLLGPVIEELTYRGMILKFLDKFNENEYVQSAFYGLRPAVTALIAAAGFEVLKISVLTLNKFAETHAIIDLINVKSTILFAILLVITNKFKQHPLVTIGSAAVVGIVFSF